MELTSAVMGLGLLIVVIGSVAPWVTSPFVSASGTDADGKITIGLAVLTFLVLVLVHGTWRLYLVGLLALGISGLGLYEFIHIHHGVVKATVFGHQIAHVGWGVYAVICGGLITSVSAGYALWRG
jgi:hypothetical protein